MNGEILASECQYTLVCVDSYKDREFSGRLYHPLRPEGVLFTNVVDMVSTLEGLMEEPDVPRPMSSPRSFGTREIVYHPCERSAPRSGNFATFQLRIMYQYHASWQGSILWMDENRTEAFRSTMELLLLMDSALQSKGADEAKSACQVEASQIDSDEQTVETLITKYLQKVEQDGLSTRTIYSYRRTLKYLNEYLASGGEMNEHTLQNWLRYMEEQGYPESERKAGRSAVRGFMSFLGIELEKRTPAPNSPLNREEFILILQTARMMGHKRAYLIIKTMANAGIRQEELQQLTVETLKQGCAWMTRGKRKRFIKFYEPLRSELLAYAKEKGIQTGLVFVSRHGVMGHSHIWKDVKQVCRRAGVAEEKSTPSSLYKLYQATYFQVCSGDVTRTDERFCKLLEKEEAYVRWEEPKDQK